LERIVKVRFNSARSKEVTADAAHRLGTLRQITHALAQFCSTRRWHHASAPSDTAIRVGDRQPATRVARVEAWCQRRVLLQNCASGVRDLAQGAQAVLRPAVTSLDLAELKRTFTISLQRKFCRGFRCTGSLRL